MSRRDEKKLWKRDGRSKREEWDDSALVEAYDKAILLVKENIAKNNNKACNGTTKKNKNSTKTKTPTKKWKIGDFCRALYEEDGLLYEAKVIDVNEREDFCVVKFVGYGNREEVDPRDLKPSQGKSMRSKQEELAKNLLEKVNAKYESEDSSTFSDDPSSSDVTGKSYENCFDHHQSKEGSASYDCPSSASESFCNPASLPKSAVPAPPMPFPLKGDVNDDEALASMLMSWYMAGYHTGFYQGRQSNQGAGGSRKVKHRCCHSSH